MCYIYAYNTSIRAVLYTDQTRTPEARLGAWWSIGPQQAVLVRAGFLPTFGPAFVNLYGAPREFSSDMNAFEYLDLGKARVCLRLRLLLDDEKRTLHKESCPVEHRRAWRIAGAYCSRCSRSSPTASQPRRSRASSRRSLRAPRCARTRSSSSLSSQQTFLTAMRARARA